MAVAIRLPHLIGPREQGEVGPRLTLVPERDQRYWRVLVAVSVIAAVMFGVVSLRAHMAQQEMRLDKLNYDISRARNHFETLRAERARLQSPDQLISQARAMGLVPSVGSHMVDIPAHIAAEVASSVGKVDADVIAHTESPLDEFGRMKATVIGAP